MKHTLRAGAAAQDICPKNSQFLFGYPFVPRYSSGIHDPIFSTALYLDDARTSVMFIANDIIFVSKRMTERVRKEIAARTPILMENIMISATHTHSAPHTVDHISNENDPAVPPADKDYIDFLVRQMVKAGCMAYEAAVSAEIGLACTQVKNWPTNRRNPHGPTDPQLPVLLVKSSKKKKPIACMVNFSLHPTVLHEGSTLVSADFPGMVRKYLQEEVLGPDCPVLYHTGPAGDQSPRYLVQANTFAEADRLGKYLGEAIAEVIPGIVCGTRSLGCRRTMLNLPKKTFPSVSEAKQQLQIAKAHLELLQQQHADPKIIRTAECDWFGAEETLTLAHAAQDNRLEKVYATCLPAEIQVIRVGPWFFVGWPGEFFVEYALEVKNRSPNTFVISLANGELQGYIVTEAAARQGGYEVSNALFSHQSGLLMVKATLDLLNSFTTDSTAAG